MKKKIFKIFALLMILAMVAAPASAKTIEAVPAFDGPDPRVQREVSQEIQDLFKDGMSIDEFLLLNKGPIPHALQDYANKPMVVIVQMERPPLAEYMVTQGLDSKSMASTDQKSYTSALKSAQEPVISQVKQFGGVVMGQYAITYNGLLVKVTAEQLQTLRGMKGVQAIKRAPQHEISLVNSIPLIRADEVWNSIPGYTGAGVTIGVIDTGIDYTHAMFGGSGDPADYAANDPDVVEPGSFPTVKVVGGYDFAGTDYNASDENHDVPVPDNDPLDEGGHGTHVASTAAGIDFDPMDALGAGVAPDAKLYALKVFGADGSTNLAMNAIEWATDPNGNGDTSDHLDVINMSLGSSFGPGDPDDPEIIAVENAAAAGVFIAASSGNSGNSSYITGAPGAADSALSVAASTTGYGAFPTITYNDGSEQEILYQTSDNAFEPAITAVLTEADVIDGAGNGELCDTAGIAPNALSGDIALIARGTCSFEDKINNAETLGAVAAIIYNHATGGDTYINMAVGTVTLPAGFVTNTDGLTLKALGDTQSITVGPDSDVIFVSTGDPDIIADFSSRGPRGYDSVLKPEISAPGVDIFAAKMGGGDTGTSMSGTSMAAPHIAGVAALMKEAHGNWTVEQIKAAMMNTAVDLDWGLEDTDIPLQGAGRVDALRSVMTEALAVGDSNLVSLSWGLIESNEDTFTSEKTVTLYNYSGEEKTYDITIAFTNGSEDGVTLTTKDGADSISVPAGGTEVVTLTLEVDMTQMPLVFGDLEEYYGFVSFTEPLIVGDAKVTQPRLRVPFYFSPRPYTEMTKTSTDPSFDPVVGTAQIELMQSGPQASSLWAFPTMLVDPAEPDQMDAGDLRYVGLDHGGLSPYGPILTAAFVMEGPIHTQQPYFSEVDFYIDADQDGLPETVNFNYNTSFFTGGDDNNDWFVVQIDYTDGMAYQGSPYYIWADFNSGVQEWYLPATWNHLDEGTNPTFDFEVFSFDFNGSTDEAGMGQFDLSKPPLGWEILDADDVDIATPEDEAVTLNVWVNDMDGYHYSQPKGILLLDYFGRPGIGQAQFFEFTHTLFMPLIFK